MKKRENRQAAIKQIVRSRTVRTQRDLVDSLLEMGYKCTQATVSRDITEMGLRKTNDGSYVLVEDMTMRRMVSDMVCKVERADNLIVIKVLPGTASGVAAALDAAELPEVMGTVAGDDTILVIARSVENAKEFEDTINRMHV